MLKRLLEQRQELDAQINTMTKDIIEWSLDALYEQSLTVDMITAKLSDFFIEVKHADPSGQKECLLVRADKQKQKDGSKFFVEIEEELMHWSQICVDYPMHKQVIHDLLSRPLSYKQICCLKNCMDGSQNSSGKSKPHVEWKDPELEHLYQVYKSWGIEITYDEAKAYAGYEKELFETTEEEIRQNERDWWLVEDWYKDREESTDDTEEGYSYSYTEEDETLLDWASSLSETLTASVAWENGSRVPSYEEPAFK